MKNLITFAILIAATTTRAHGANDATAFEKLKSLAGTWHGDAVVGKDKVPTNIQYRVVSGGHAVEETISPNDPQAMVTMYYLDGKSLVMTHYCHMGNQPHMKLADGSSAEGMRFEFDGGANIKPGDLHMHTMNLKFVDADHIQTQWYAMSGGKPLMHIDMDLHRVSAGTR